MSSGFTLTMAERPVPNRCVAGTPMVVKNCEFKFRKGSSEERMKIQNSKFEVGDDE